MNLNFQIHLAASDQMKIHHLARAFLIQGDQSGPACGHSSKSSQPFLGSCCSEECERWYQKDVRLTWLRLTFID